MKHKQHLPSQWYRTKKFNVDTQCNSCRNTICNQNYSADFEDSFLRFNRGIPQNQWCCLLILKVLYYMYTKVLTFGIFLFFLLYSNSQQSVVSYVDTQFHSQRDTIYVITTASLYV